MSRHAHLMRGPGVVSHQHQHNKEEVPILVPACAAVVPYDPASASDPVPRACVCGLGGSRWPYQDRFGPMGQSLTLPWAAGDNCSYD